jgi:Flp pilus assembly protein TadB
MTGPVLVLAAAVGVAAAGATGLVVAPRRRLADKVRPYRAAVGDRNEPVSPSEGAAWTPARAVTGARVLPRVDSPASRERLAVQLRSAGLPDASIEQFRVRQFGIAGAIAMAGIAMGALVLHSPAMTLLLAGCGAAVGFSRSPAQLAQRIEARQHRMRLELVTVDQVLAIHVRAGAGPVQAITRIVDRGHGEIVDELRGILTSIRSGRAEAEAFRHAATVTAEPHAARTYRLFALAAEQGADLGTALRALSDDLRDVRRDELRRAATRRRAAMLVPTIAVLAPIMLLFVVAPLPSIVLGGR